MKTLSVCDALHTHARYAETIAEFRRLTLFVADQTVTTGVYLPLGNCPVCKSTLSWERSAAAEYLRKGRDVLDFDASEIDAS